MGTQPVDTQPGRPEEDRHGKVGYKVLATVGAAVSASVARKALTTGWRKVTGKEPPSNPAHPDVRWREAAIWVVASGAGVAAARLAAQRRVAATWRRASGMLPPGMDDDAKK